MSDAYTVEDLLCRPEEVRQRSSQHWRFIEDCIPFPTFDMACPDCGHDRFVYSSVQVHTRREAPINRQMDANFKCQACNHYMMKTVPVTEDEVKEFERNFVGTSKADHSQLLEFFELEREEVTDE